jgi:hypothetical protein
MQERDMRHASLADGDLSLQGGLHVAFRVFSISLSHSRSGWRRLC